MFVLVPPEKRQVDFVRADGNTMLLLDHIVVALEQAIEVFFKGGGLKE